MPNDNVSTILIFDDDNTLLVPETIPVYREACLALGWPAAHLQLLKELKARLENDPIYEDDFARARSAALYAGVLLLGIEVLGVPDIERPLANVMLANVFGPAGRQWLLERDAEMSQRVLDKMREMGTLDETEAMDAMFEQSIAGIRAIIKGLKGDA